MKSFICNRDNVAAFFLILLVSLTAFVTLTFYTNIPDINYPSSASNTYKPAWSYECQKNRCVKVELNEDNITSAVSLPVCRIFCSDIPGTLWPKPTGPFKIGQYMVYLNPDNIEFIKPQHRNQDQLWDENEKRFLSLIYSKVDNLKTLKKADGKKLTIKLIVDSDDLNFNLNTDEGYKLLLSRGNDDVFAEIRAKSYFGGRYGLETLSQLIVYDDIRREIQVIAEGEINDSPVFKHRGLLLDTSRNYFSVDSIKKTIDAMAMAKLNIFHWHVTDSHSFPLVIKSQPDLVKYGAYSPLKIYTQENVKEIVDYGRVRGVTVMPEFDAPAHVGEGWQKKNMTACFNMQPWKNFCVEPPCGQLDPTVDKLYDVLEDIYREMFEMFQQPNVFHMGGDEVSVACWNSSDRIRNWMRNKEWNLEESDFMKLWGHFQVNALNRVDKLSEKLRPIILWTSRLTDVPYVDQYLDKDRYIIQIWTTGYDSKVKDLLKRGFKVILSNYDALYFDCGFGGWVTDGNNWCSPYIGWQKVYMNSPEKIAGEFVSQVLGAEGTIWSEQIDEHTVDSRFWPRASALAERLWSNPKGHWREAESRLLIHREQLVQNGIHAEALQPQWCLQNENECPINQ